jgi:hypothetical protein
MTRQVEVVLDYARILVKRTLSQEEAKLIDVFLE